MHPLIEGLILGLTLAIFFGFGPALFALIQTSIHRGFWSGFLLAVGIFLSDLAVVGLCFFGAIQIITKPENHLAFGLFSGGILIIFGIVTYSHKIHIDENNKEIKPKPPRPIIYILKGFFLNIANPFIWIFWMGVVVAITANYGAEIRPLVLFFSVTLLTVLGTDVLKCFGAYKIKRYLTPKIMTGVNRIAGIGLVLFGLFLIFRVIFDF